MPNLPYTEKQIERALKELDKEKLILLYNNNQYLQYTRFREFQTNDISKEGESDIPCPTPELLQSYSKPTPELLQTEEEDKEELKDKDKELLIYYVDWETSTINNWNSLCDKYPMLCKIKSISPTRKKHLKQRYSNKHFVEQYHTILTKIPESKFLLGENDRGWVISLDWLIRNDDNYVKVLEGKYTKYQDPRIVVKENLKKIGIGD